MTPGRAGRARLLSDCPGQRANGSGRTPVMFIHGLWLLPSSWDRWATMFEEAGYTALSPGWPDDPDTVEEARAHPEVFANKSVGRVADHYAAVAGKLDRRPALVGHSFGGLIAQIVAGRGLSAATVAIDAAPFRGVLPYERQKRNPGVTEFVEIPGGGHALTIDSGWAEVAGVALGFIRRFT